MEIFDGHRALFRPLSAPSVALGNFDGMHRGHQRLLEKTVALARERDGDATLLTFDPHPAKVLAPALAPTLITSRERKLELIESFGIDVCIMEPFDRDLAGLTPNEFLTQVIVDVLGAVNVVVGYDFTYGKRRSGTTETLRAFGDANGFATHVVDQITVDGLVASSTKVRNFVASGNLEGARLLLGRDFDVDGVVERGAGRGRSIGVPTANIRTSAELLPPGGVYAVRVQILGADDPATLHGGAANLGTNPTFVNEGDMSLEVHLLDFDQDRYGRPLRVSFIERLRGERRFDGPQQLVAQIRSDIDQARKLLGSD